MKKQSVDIFGVYITQKADLFNLIEILKSMIEIARPTVIMGDFNICLFKNKNNPVTKFLTSIGFHQLVNEATHIEVKIIKKF